ncbi:MAG: hypothetical protein OMM_12912 [Candidatus Magnetoglobus multicellularis str. Araruama]|uniref:Uncharacterized protein n=1 Tax=Candidatus Magnetoglobus multicellularis str. Araruama TaxID=890399 RepID=A0A1V1NUV9_9BACT|nr:MAG: hypothetical protein OMM_12912 [Candidatus Magnetoglobus multicellularis str. Araruama]
MNIPVKRTAYILGSILIIGYAFQIIYSNYQANIELRNRSLQRAYTDFFDKYSSVKTFLKERQKDFQDLASDRTISTYFQNKAMGMTMMYGLAISLNNVKQRLISFQTTNILGKHTLFPKIIFLDTNKHRVTVLADNLVDQITYDKDAVIDSHKTSMQHDTTNPEYLIISTPCILKDKIVGHLIGWMSYGLFFDHFFSNQQSCRTCHIANWQSQKYFCL